MNQSDNLQNNRGSGSSSSAGEEIKQDAAQLKDKAASQAEKKTKQATQQATSAAHSTSSALREAGDKLEQDSDTPNWLGSAFKQAADSVADLAETVEGKEPREMMRDVNRFARDNPTAFLAGSALAGFAAARVMKAGAQQSDASLDDIDPTSGSDNSSSNSGSTQTTRMGASSARTPGVAPSIPTSRTTTIRGGA